MNLSNSNEHAARLWRCCAMDVLDDSQSLLSVLESLWKVFLQLMDSQQMLVGLRAARVQRAERLKASFQRLFKVLLSTSKLSSFDVQSAETIFDLKKKNKTRC